MRKDSFLHAKNRLTTILIIPIPLSDRVKKLDVLLNSKNLKLGQEYIAEEKII